MQLNKIYILIVFLLLLGCDSLFPKGEYFKWEPFPQVNPPPVEMELKLSRHRASWADPIEMTLNIYIRSKEPIYMTLHGQADNPEYDFLVARMDSIIVWNRLPEPESLAAYGRVYQPGEIITFKTLWLPHSDRGVRIKKGNYLVYGINHIFVTDQDNNILISDAFATEPDTIFIE